MSRGGHQSDRLRESVSWCKQQCKASGSSFYPAFRLLDLPRREAMYALYAFARITDDLGDSAESTQLRREKLSQWRQRTAEVLGGAGECVESDGTLTEYSMLWPALKSSADLFVMPAVHFDELIQGVMLDLEHTQPADWKTTEDYCYHVATTVGLLCTYIWRDDAQVTPDRELAHKCGVAFQLTNILRDVAEDAAMGRIYLPAKELGRFDIDSQAWLSGQPDGDWRGLISSVAKRAYSDYDAGRAVVHQLSPRSKRMFGLMWRSYRQLLENVESNKERLWTTKRIKLTRLQKFRLLSSSLLRT
ncbi:MAG: phytoene/squalene synthase family protein [Aureliella sp.]